jgi:hypothetical protein
LSTLSSRFWATSINKAFIRTLAIKSAELSQAHSTQDSAGFLTTNAFVLFLQPQRKVGSGR